MMALGVAAVLLAGCGKPQDRGGITGTKVPAAVIEERQERQRDSAPRGAVDRQILFGDLHVHTTFSPDAFIMSVPLMGGTGLHPPADACDFARYCSSLDFWSINDHAEGITPRRWAETRQSIRECNARSGDPSNPDLVSFLGWEWSQVNTDPGKHYGHKNVIFLYTEDDNVPSRAIAAPRAQLAVAPMGRAAQLMMSLMDFENREFYWGIQGYSDGDSLLVMSNLTITENERNAWLTTGAGGHTRLYNSMCADNDLDIIVVNGASTTSHVYTGTTPLFVDPTAGDYRLQAGSPGVDDGDQALQGTRFCDLDHGPRVVGGEVDLGAYERSGLFADDFESGDSSFWSTVVQ